MNDKIKLIIEIPKDLSERVYRASSVPDMQGTDIVNVINIVKNGIPLDTVKAEIKKKCDCIDDIARAYIYQYAPHREIQDLLCEILESIDNAESEDI